MWGIAWGIKIWTSDFQTEESSYNIDIIGYINGSGERIRTFDLRVMRPMHGFVVVCYPLLSSIMECDFPRVPA